MNRIRIKAKNYRAFSEAEPLDLEVGEGFTAIVGRNNSGKSASKLFFYEFRQLFEALACPLGGSPSITTIAGQAGQFSFSYLGVTDVYEIFNNTNTRPITVEIELLEHSSDQSTDDGIFRMVGTCERSTPNLWKIEMYAGSNPRVDLLQRPNRGFDPTAALINFDGLYTNCRDFMDAASILAGARYYGPFRNAINQGAANYYDLKVGTGFIDLWNEWKTSGVKHQSKAIDQVTEDIRKLFEFGRLEITASQKLKTLMVSVDGQPHRLEELGSGLSQFIMVLGNAATNPPSLLLIDEPETHLHPALQMDFLTSVGRYARDGVIFSTHSIGLARSVASKIYSIQRRNGHSLIGRFEATPNYLEFVGELSFSTFKDLGSDRLLLVEGVNDVLVLQQFLRLINKDHTTVILPLGGDQLATGREVELSELTRLSKNIFAVVDSERVAAGDPPAPRRVAFEDVCRKIGIDVCVTQLRSIENYFVDNAVKSAFDDSYSALTPYQHLKDAAKPWRKSDDWKIAGQMRWDDIKATDVGAFLDRM